MTVSNARGLIFIREALGKKLINITRYVLGFGNTNDEYGHGVTELKFENYCLVVKPGENEDFLVLENTEVRNEYSAEYWTKVDFSPKEEFLRIKDHELCYVDCFSDGHEDIGLAFNFGKDVNFFVFLDETDLVVFDQLPTDWRTFDGTKPEFRERIE